MKIDKAKILEANAVLDTVHQIIADYLTKLQNVEAAIICVDEDIAVGRYNCYHRRPIPLFHTISDTANYPKRNISKYEIREYTDTHIVVVFNRNEINVPYAFSQAAFESVCETLFKKSKEEIKLCKKLKNEEMALINNRNWEDKRIASKHFYKNYSYYWKECPQCMGAGHVYVGTGEWEEDPYSYADSPRQREITKEVKCPRCEGHQGIIVVSDEEDDSQKEFPCSRNRFVLHEDDILKVLVSS